MHHQHANIYHYSPKNLHPKYILKKGQVLILSLILFVVASIFSATLFTKVGSFLNFNANSLAKEQALQAAEAGVENALWQLNKTAGAYTGPETVAIGSTGTFSVSVVDKSPGIKTVTSIGYVPNSTSPKSKQTVIVDVAQTTSGTPISFPFAIHAGTGGIELTNDAVVTGEVFSNQTPGLSIRHGAGPATINGNAYAAASIDTTITIPPPYKKFENHSPIPPLSTIDYDYWIAEAKKGGFGPCSFPPNTTTIQEAKECIGDVIIGSARTVMLKGPLHITGNLIINGPNTFFNLDESFGSNGTVIVVEGTVTISQGAKVNPTTASPKGYILIASRWFDNDDKAITIANEGINALFHASAGVIHVTNGSKVAALVGKTIEIVNGSVVNYDSSLNSARFSPGGGSSSSTAWTIKRGSYQMSKLDTLPTPAPGPTPSPTPAPSTITIHAAGTPVLLTYPTMELLINDVVVRTFTNVQGDPNSPIPSYQQFSYTHTGPLTKEQVKVRFTNDAKDIFGDRNLRVDQIVIDGTSYQTEAPTTYSTGTSTTTCPAAPGFKENEWLQCNGYFQY